MTLAAAGMTANKMDAARAPACLMQMEYSVAAPTDENTTMIASSVIARGQSEHVIGAVAAAMPASGVEAVSPIAVTAIGSAPAQCLPWYTPPAERPTIATTTAMIGNPALWSCTIRGAQASPTAAVARTSATMPRRDSR